jgi:beta-aspartyl-peptidase (threonine type)
VSPGPRPLLLLHAGATIDPDLSNLEPTALALDRIFLDADRLLQEGAAALTAVARAVAAMEADPLFNAGYGGKLQADGVVRLSTSAMDGSRRRFGAVINVQRLYHPSRLALHLLEQEDRVLDGDGAGASATRPPAGRRR